MPFILHVRYSLSRDTKQIVRLPIRDVWVFFTQGLQFSARDILAQVREVVGGTCIVVRGKITKQDRRCTYNVKLWRVHVTVVAVGKQ